MSKKKSFLWDYFDEEAEDPTNAICKIAQCGKKISRGKAGTLKARLSNTGMRTHLRTCHSKEWQEFLDKETRQSDAVATTEQEKMDACETENSGNNIFKLKTKRSRDDFFQQNLPDMIQSQQTYDANDPRARTKHRAILTMMVTDLKPFSMVNDPGFLHYSKIMEPRFTVGSDMYYRRLLDKVYVKGKLKVQNKMKNDDPTCVSIQLDGWSAHKHGYIGLLANYVTKEWKRAKICLACVPFDESHTGENIARWVEAECDRWAITDSIGVVTTDTASNMIKMMEYLPDHFSHGGCMNHILQLVINDQLLEKPSIKNMIRSCRNICSYANRAVGFAQAVIKKQIDEGKEKRSCLNLLQDVVTRWNSTYLMLERFLKLQSVVRSLLLDEEWKNKIDDNLTNAEWSLMGKVVNVLGVFFEATLRFSSSSSCISEVIPTITSLIVALNPNPGGDQGVTEFKRQLKVSMLDRVGGKEMVERFSVATLLDPR